MREEYLLPAAREAFEHASDSDRQRFHQIILYLCENPGLASPLKEKFDVPPVVLSLYDDDEYWIVYDLPDDATVRIWMLGKAPDRPRPR